MKYLFCFAVHLFIVLTVTAQQGVVYFPKPLFPSDPKGLKLPPGEPRAVDTNGNVIWIDENYSTPQYHQAALEAVIQEASQVAVELRLPEQLPIAKTNLVGTFIGPFGYNVLRGRIGNITTTNYTYYLSVDNKFSYLDNMHQEEYFRQYQTHYEWPISQINTNQAYQLATQWLEAVSMDVEGLNRDCSLMVVPYNYFPSPKGKFVPLYFVVWTRKDLRYGDTASVIVFVPTKQLLSLRVEDGRYILRKPIAIPDLDALLPGPGLIITNHPTPMIPIRAPAG
jgi:hypothetical protein